MAVEPATNQAQSQDLEAHVRDYSGFIKLFKYGAIFSFITAMVVMIIIS
jgi:hypothetical protein